MFMRGGTSRAVCFRADVLSPYDRVARERIVLAALGSPDPHGRQIDGLGGGISSLSKVVIVGRSGRADADVSYTFGQVEVGRPRIDWSGTCGNMSAAVGPFAIDEGLVPAVEPVSQVRVFSTNTGGLYVAHVPVRYGQAEVEGRYTIAGVPGPGACICLEYLDPGGSLGRGVLPTGTPRQALACARGRLVSVSIVDVGIPTVFVRADELGANATRLAQELDEDRALQATLEDLRCQAAVALGLAASTREAHHQAVASPKIALVAPPTRYRTSGAQDVLESETDLLARAISVGKTHRTLPGTVSMCTAVAADVEGTVVHEVSRTSSPARVRIGHPAGVIDVGVRVRRRGKEWHADSVTLERTARRIMEGSILVPSSYLQGTPWFAAGESTDGPPERE